MIYKLYKLTFLNGIHIGKNSLSDTEMSICADTVFSAMCHEMIKKGQDEFDKFIKKIFDGAIIISDMLPYYCNSYYIPKPMLKIENKSVQADLSLRKSYKKLAYVALESLDDYINGSLDVVYENDVFANDIGNKTIRTCVSINGEEEPVPYNVATYHFKDFSGLYMMAGFENEDDVSIIDECMTALGYSGIGGKRKSGLGRFTWSEGKITQEISNRLINSADKYISISCCLPKADEMEKALDEGSYLLIKRSGFVTSDNYADENRKKRDLYVLQAGACFTHKFEGCIVDVSDGGAHPVYRYARPFFVGVNL